MGGGGGEGRGEGIGFRTFSLVLALQDYTAPYHTCARAPDITRLSNKRGRRTSPSAPHRWDPAVFHDLEAELWQKLFGLFSRTPA